MKEQFGFISTGSKIAMYTLRIMYLCEGYCDGQTFTFEKDYYVVNLSNDKATAESKAQEICDNYGIPFKGNAEFELNEIRRKRDAESKERQEMIEREAERIRIEQEAAFERNVSEGVFIVGKYTGKTAEEVAKTDLAYVFYVAEQKDYSDKFSVNIKIAKNYIEQNNIKKPGFIGNIGDTVKLNLVLNKVAGFYNMYNVKNFVFTCTEESGATVTFFSSAKKFLELKDGEKFTIEGLVKDHSKYNNWNQTVIKKPKMAK